MLFFSVLQKWILKCKTKDIFTCILATNHPVDGMCMDFISLYMRICEDVVICFCNCWNTRGGGPTSKTFVTLYAPYEHSHVACHIHLFETDRLSEENKNYNIRGRNKTGEQKEV